LNAARRTRHLDLEGMPGPQDPEKFSFWVRSMLAFAEFLLADAIYLFHYYFSAASQLDKFEALG
jgi:hypothetical protein